MPLMFQTKKTFNSQENNMSIEQNYEIVSVCRGPKFWFCLGPPMILRLKTALIFVSLTDNDEDSHKINENNFETN